MITKTNLPPTYRPYERLTLCSNLMIGGGYPMQVGESIPLLIGQGEVPQVWLSAPTNSTGKSFAEVVKASVAAHPAFIVTADDGLLSISAGGKSVLKVRAVGADSAEVDFLDFRPIGFNVYGDQKMLHVGGMLMSRNTVSGGGTFLALGQP